MKKYISEFKSLIHENKHSWANLLANPKFKHIYDDMLEYCPTIFKSLKLNKRILGWCYLNEDTETFEWPKCEICGEKLEDINASIYTGFSKTCKNKTCKLAYRAKQQKKSLILKYGVENVSQLKSVREKIKEISLQKYGTTTPNSFGSKTFKQSMLSKYGVDNCMKLEAIKTKISDTCLSKYGVKCSFEAEEVKEKIKETCLSKYGVENGGGSKVAIEHIKETRKKHQLDDPLFTQKIVEKFKQTSRQKYGCDFPLQSDIVKNNLKQSFIAKYGCSNIATLESFNLMLNSQDYQPLFSLSEYDNAKFNTELKFKCSHCGKIYTSLKQYGIRSRCYDCFPKMDVSSQSERDVATFIGNLTSSKIETNIKSIVSPYELDIYIPDKKLAIKFDGLYWHSEDIKPNNYHLNKTNLCEKLGIQLIHIFENEWILKQDIVKSRLKNLLGVYDKTIYARCCEIKPVASGESKDFQDKNHIQGSVNAGVSLGLYFDDELVGLMTFGKTRFSKKYEYELLRFCNKLGYHIPGAASKLLKHFERNYQPKSLISYADRRWSKGNVYEKLGFKLDHKSGPNYWYWREGLKLESRVKYQKHKLKNVLENFDGNKTEVENMKANGYNRIFDCGNLVYVKEYISNEIA